MIAFVIFEKNIVFGRVLLYEAALKHKRFKFAVCKNIIESVNIFNHPAHFERVVVLRAEILAYSVFEGFRLSYIYYFACFIFHNIYAGRERQAHCLFSQFAELFVHTRCLLSKI